MNRHLELLCLQRGAEHLHLCGARVIAEYLREVAQRIGGMPAMLNTLGEYERRLDPAVLRRVGGDRFPPRALHVVPGGKEPHR
jgi:hypothetical protein